MRRSIKALVGSGVIVVVALVAWKAGSSAQVCRTTVSFHGLTYTQAETSEEVISGDDLGEATQHSCGSVGSYERQIALSRIPGIDPTIAIATPTAAYLVYLAPGVNAQDLPEKLGTVRVREPS